MKPMESAFLEPEKGGGNSIPPKPLVTIIVPAYNEAEIIEKSLNTICQYMESLEARYRWELIVVDDGSTDDTPLIADAFAKGRENVLVLHHVINSRLGQALRTAFKYCKGDFVITLDIDLSYSPEHIEMMLDKIVQTRAQVVLASPYMKGGKVSNVPWSRRKLSVWANRFLAFTAKEGNLSTLTGMVRGYEGDFLRSLDLKAMDTEINAEIIYKAMMLRARIVEVPARLDWGPQKPGVLLRRSSMKIARGILSYLLSGFFFRPFLFFIIPGFLLMTMALYPFMWVLIHTVNSYEMLPPSLSPFDVRLSAAVAEAFRQSPHSFIIGSIMVMLGIQMFSLGVLAQQSKRYFEELFHLGTTIYGCNQVSGSWVVRKNLR
jgi:glycosyltransferase involved in cell wall biosynthesis